MSKIKHETLVAALSNGRDLLSDPDRWTQGQYAKDYRGLAVPASSKDAVCWCSTGAVAKVAKGPSVRSLVREYLEAALRIDGYVPADLIEFNDAYEHAQVIDIWEKAIALAKSHEGQPL